MKKRYWFLSGCIICLVLLAATFCLADDSWQNIGREMLDVRSTLVDPLNFKIIYIGTTKGVFKTEDAGDSWRSILLLKGSNTGVNFLITDPQNGNSIYAATDSGLYYSHNNGLRWNRIFRGKNYLEANCLAVAVLPSGIYLGTKQGLFVSRDKGKSWHKEAGKLGKSRIFNIVYVIKNPDCLYVASVDGVFKSKDSGKNWERIVVTYPRENEDWAQGNDADTDEEEKVSQIRYLAVDPNNPSNLYLATSRGVLKSQDNGLSWEIFDAHGLLSSDVYFLLFSKYSQLYCISRSGIFLYQDSLWNELSFTLGVSKINLIALDKEGWLYACTGKGFFKLNPIPSYASKSFDLFRSYSKEEPEIKEVQRVAIRYAEVDPDKISRWRRQAAKKAWFPKLSADIGRNVTDLWHWETGSSAIGQSGDDLLRRGKDSLDWDVGISWDLSGLIWDSDQTSIDVRSRLMVELRNDILDEVNKLYFERLRVKMELDNLSIEDKKKRFDKELRIRELTASIDALTGGYFSEQIIKNKS
jgi:photosystem II stability/assembly factor-like uncharacterized protein